MHHIYHTEGIILGNRNFGEAGKYYSIFTRDLGMVRASASGVRKMSSKLRFVLHDYSYIKIDLVKGKDFWRVTSAGKTNMLESLSKNKKTREVLANISVLLKKLITGEEPNEILFNDLLKGFLVLEKYKNESELRDIETFIVLRILHHLGYIGGSEKLETFTRSPFEENLIFEIAKNRNRILSQINKALRETQL